MSIYRQYYTYLYFDPSTSQHIYVGKGCGSRAYSHLKGAANKHFNYRLKKMAAKGVVPEIRLYPQQSELGAFELEIFLIKTLGRRDKGTGQLLNHTDGGEGGSGWIAPLEVREKLSKMRKGKKRGPFSEMHKANLAKARSNRTKAQKEKTAQKLRNLYLGVLRPEHKGHKRSIGEKNGNSKLTEDAVRAIRAATGSQQSIADQFGITQNMVSKIRLRQNWKNVQ